MSKVSILIIISLVLLNTLPVFAQHVELKKYDFRKTTWGMSIEEVKAIEKEELEKEKIDMLIYNSNISGMDASIVYVFAENKLVKTAYQFISEDIYNTDYLAYYEKVTKDFNYKYAEAKLSKRIWNSKTYHNDHSQWEYAISIGHLICISEWEIESTLIDVVLHGYDNMIIIDMEYISKEYRILLEKANKERANVEF